MRPWMKNVYIRYLVDKEPILDIIPSELPSFSSFYIETETINGIKYKSITIIGITSEETLDSIIRS